MVNECLDDPWIVELKEYISLAKANKILLAHHPYYILFNSNLKRRRVQRGRVPFNAVYCWMGQGHAPSFIVLRPRPDQTAFNPPLFNITLKIDRKSQPLFVSLPTCLPWHFILENVLSFQIFLGCQKGWFFLHKISLNQGLFSCGPKANAKKKNKQLSNVQLALFIKQLYPIIIHLGFSWIPCVLCNY